MTKADQRELAEAVFAASRISGMEAACQLYLQLRDEDGLEYMALDLAAQRGTPDHKCASFIRALEALANLVSHDPDIQRADMLQSARALDGGRRG